MNPTTAAKAWMKARLSAMFAELRLCCSFLEE
jgi:hypothetical protein